MWKGEGLGVDWVVCRNSIYQDDVYGARARHLAPSPFFSLCDMIFFTIFLAKEGDRKREGWEMEVLV